MRKLTLWAVALLIASPALAQNAQVPVANAVLNGNIQTVYTPLTPNSDGTYSPKQGAVGDTLSGTADSGAGPVKVGGKYNYTLPTFTDGQRGDLQLDSRGALRTVVSNFSNTQTAVVGAAVDSATGFNGLNVVSTGTNFNGATWDRQRGNIDSAALITLSAAAPTTTNSADQTNYNGRGVVLFISISAIATQTVVVNLQEKDPASGNYVTVASSASLSAVATTRLVFYPGITVASNTAVSDVLSRTWRVQAVGSVGGTVSLTVAASNIL